MEQATAGDTTAIDSNADALDSALTEPVRRDRLIAQRGVFASLSPRVPGKMYVVTKGDAAADRYGLLADGASAHTNTYFGRFPASFWQRWTDVKTVNLQLTYGCSGSARFVVHASDAKGRERIVSVETVSGSGELDLEVPIERFVDGGAIWFAAEASNGSLLVSDARWTVAAPEHLRPAAVVICTFNRADDCTVTVGTLASDDGAMADIDAVCIVDQGTDQVRSRPAFGEVAEKLGSKLVYLTQPNLGGAGGFSRGMYEITRSPKSAHANVIVMDDDILCEPESVLRLNAFANMTVQPTIVGAQMLSLSNPPGPACQCGTRGARRDQSRRADPGRQDGRRPDQEEAGSAVRRRLERLVDVSAPRRDHRRLRAADSAVLPVGRHRVRHPRAFRRAPHGHAAERGRVARRLLPQGLRRLGALLQHPQRSRRLGDLRAFRRDPTSPSTCSARSGELIVSMQYGLAATFIKAAEDFLAGPRFPCTTVVSRS